MMAVRTKVLIVFFATIYIFMASTDMMESHQNQEGFTLKNYQLECVDETKVDPNSVVRFKAGDWGSDEPSLKKWVLCVLIKMNLMTPDGVYRFDEAMVRVGENDQDMAETLIDKCLSTIAIPPSDIAWKYVHCLHVNDPFGNFSSISILTQV